MAAAADELQRVPPPSGRISLPDTPGGRGVARTPEEIAAAKHARWVSIIQARRRYRDTVGAARREYEVAEAAAQRTYLLALLPREAL